MNCAIWCRKLAPATEGLGLEQVIVRARIPNPSTGELHEMVVRISSPGGSGILITFRPADKLQPIKSLTEYDQKVVRMRQRGLIYPYEIIQMLTPPLEHKRAEFPAGDFVEHDLDPEGRLVAVDRPYGQNKAKIIVVVRNFTTKYPEGMTRVLMLGDPGKDLGAIAEPECRLILAALDLAQAKGVPLEWFPISAGAKISMASGVENMDWIARVLRRLIEFTQAGAVNLLLNGIKVGGQPYWNAEATMLMHTRVLTGKRALDYSGSVSAKDNQGIASWVSTAKRTTGHAISMKLATFCCATTTIPTWLRANVSPGGTRLQIPPIGMFESIPTAGMATVTVKTASN